MSPPPRGRSARSALCARGTVSIFHCFGDVPTTSSGDVLATFQRPLVHARTSPEQVVGTSPEQGVWVGLASLAHPCLQDGMTETEALGAALAAPPPPAPLGAQGATRSQPRSSSVLASPAPPPPQGAPTGPPWATPAHRPSELPRRAPQGAAPVAPLQAHRPQLPEPSTGSSMSKGGGVREQAVVLGELQEARANVESLRRRVKKLVSEIGGVPAAWGPNRGQERERERFGGEPAGKGGAEGGRGASKGVAGHGWRVAGETGRGGQRR